MAELKFKKDFREKPKEELQEPEEFRDQSLKSALRDGVDSDFWQKIILPVMTREFDRVVRSMRRSFQEKDYPKAHFYDGYSAGLEFATDLPQKMKKAIEQKLEQMEVAK